MKYTKQKVIPALELCGESGNVEKSVSVCTDYIAMYNRLNDCLGQIQTAQKSGDPERVGACVVNLLRGIYGDKGAEDILQYFGGDYAEMILCVYRHIHEDVKPVLKRMAEDRKKMYKRRW